MPADLQVGEYRAAVYTTKIMLALNGVSEQQSQPFMVRVEINIAESKAWGGGKSTPVVQHIYGCRSLWSGTSRHRLAFYIVLYCLPVINSACSVHLIHSQKLQYRGFQTYFYCCFHYYYCKYPLASKRFAIGYLQCNVYDFMIIIIRNWKVQRFSWPTVYRKLFDQQLLS